MSITTLTNADPPIVPPRLSRQADGTAADDGTKRTTPFPPAPRERMRGLRLVAVWVGLTAGSWAVLGGAGYGFYSLVRSLLL
ncbi:hypothetical protein [Azospirillum picis]|uniref:Uncharacterized protein n=1 Tax=Azospirillum picis TaxID=488438 RepID=A0ABU0MEP9_9PROT|nr:hypothetical protein [Azospirillum picis]MBP2298068.1 hypothetical protein [Azospirillum picis]MDQ0531906.1 hypothetical protein [Azospirillum picis]